MTYPEQVAVRLYSLHGTWPAWAARAIGPVTRSLADAGKAARAVVMHKRAVHERGCLACVGGFVMPGMATCAECVP